MSEPPVLRDDFGDVIEVEADAMAAMMPDGSTSPAGALIVKFRVPGRAISMRLSGERLDAFRDIADREAMPGQPATAATEAAEPPRRGGEDDELCPAMGGPYVCTCQAGHAPPHLAHVPNGEIVHSWTDAA